jgi:hypothetical protein
VGRVAPSAFAAGSSLLETPNGPSGTLTFATGGSTGTVTIMGLTTEQLSVATSAGSFTANCDLQLSLIAPDSSVIAGPVCAGQSGGVSVTLPTDGSYVASLVAGPSASGSVAVSATSSGGPASITPGAAPLTLGLGPSHDTKFGFAATAGEKYSMVAHLSGRHATRDRCDAVYRFVDSGGTQIGTAANCPFIDATTIPSTGDYFLDITTGSGWQGSTMQPKLYRVVDQTGVIANNGVTVPVKTGTPGQNAAFTFTGVVGKHIAVLLSAATYKACFVTLFRPDGSGAAGSTCGAIPQGAFIEPFTLDQAGTWKIVVDPQGSTTGKATLQRYTVVDQTGTANLTGTAVNLNLSQPGQNARYSFSGTTGQRISVYLTAATFAARCFQPGQGYSLLLLRPDGTTAEGGPECSDSGSVPTVFLDAHTLDATGTWTVVVDPAFAVTGTATLQIFNVVDQTGTANLNGTPINVNLSTPGQNASFTFSGTAGQKVSEYLASSTFPAPCILTVLRPDNSVFANTSCASPSAFLDATALDATGTWTVVIDPQGPSTGTAALQVSNVVDQTGTITPGGATVAINLPTPGQNATFTFSGTSGDQRTIAITNSTFPGCSSIFVSLLRPNGTQLSIKGTCTTSLTLGPLTLDATGTWTISVNPPGAGTGTATMKLT